MDTLRNIRALALSVAMFAVPAWHANAYPILDAVQGLPSPELVTVYPDDADKNLYYFVPTRTTSHGSAFNTGG
jgi:hypothetical protein